MKTKEAYFYVRIVCLFIFMRPEGIFLSIYSKCNTRLGVPVKAEVKKVVPVHS